MKGMKKKVQREPAARTVMKMLQENLELSKQAAEEGFTLKQYLKKLRRKTVAEKLKKARMKVKKENEKEMQAIWLPVGSPFLPNPISWTEMGFMKQERLEQESLMKQEMGGA